MNEQKQPKQRLNVRVRRGLDWVYVIVQAEANLDSMSAESRKDVEAALRWIAENKQ